MTTTAVTEDAAAKRQYDAMKRRLKTLVSLDVTVGVHGKDARRGDDDGPANNVAIAAIHEFGAPAVGIPQRSWLRSAIDENHADILTEMDGVIDRVAQGAKPTAETKALGLQVVEVVREGIRSGIAPPLSETTLERRAEKAGERKAGAGSLTKSGQVRAKRAKFYASQKPLLDTGQLIQSIKAYVAKGGG